MFPALGHESLNPQCRPRMTRVVYHYWGYWLQYWLDALLRKQEHLQWHDEPLTQSSWFRGLPLGIPDHQMGQGMQVVRGAGREAAFHQSP